MPATAKQYLRSSGKREWGGGGGSTEGSADDAM